MNVLLRRRHKISRSLEDGLLKETKTTELDADSPFGLVVRMERFKNALELMEYIVDPNSLVTLEQTVRQLLHFL